MMKIKDIPKFISQARYSVNVSWAYVETNLERYQDKKIAGSEGLNLDPDFQRGHVWTKKKQREYVEFCLSGGRSSREILFNHPNWMDTFVGEMVLVDGKQRVEAVRRFIRNDLDIFGGNRLKDFDNPNILLSSPDAEFIFSINNLKTRTDVLTWYLQLNSGGVVHTKAEIDKVRALLDEENA